ncbi:MAG: hypothetical protein B6245_10320 [Desulfobacteraceae bacterium 4572_88]|nr:MAG: hypothetical protein B6245_10320 [Desulfobacteraceae bacterium 4572_88]
MCRRPETLYSQKPDVAVFFVTSGFFCLPEPLHPFFQSIFPELASPEGAERGKGFTACCDRIIFSPKAL